MALWFLKFDLLPNYTRFYKNYGFTLVFIGVVFLIYLVTSFAQEKEKNNLLQEKEKLLLEIKTLNQQKEALLEKMDSLDDPLWVDLVLRERLGVVPLGGCKVVLE